LPSGPFNSDNRSAIFDLSSETATPIGSGTGNIEKLEGGWYRCSSTQTAVSTASGYGALILLQLDDGTASYTGDVTKGIYIYGAQLEAGSTPSSYIPTSGNTATRSADTLTAASANLPWSSDAVSIQMDGRATWSDEDDNFTVIPLLWQQDSNYRIIWYWDTRTTSEEVNFGQTYSGIFDGVDDVSANYSTGINVPFNIAGRHGSTFINGAVSGTALTANTTPTALPDLSSTDLQLAFDYMGCLKTFRMWNVDLSDEGLEEATT
jgi:hypothetical protein